MSMSIPEFDIHKEWDSAYNQLRAINPPGSLEPHHHPMKVAFIIGMLRMGYVLEQRYHNPTWYEVEAFRDMAEKQAVKFFDDSNAQNAIREMMAEVNTPPPLTEEQKKILELSRKRQAERDLDKAMRFPKIMLLVVLGIYSIRLLIAKYTDDTNFIQENWNTMAVMAWLIFVWYYIHKINNKRV